jgi:DNA-binding NarL/FixJ family response regulator
VLPPGAAATYDERTMPEKRRRIGVLIVDDHMTFAEALRIAIGRERDVDVVGVVPTGDQAVAVAAVRRPDVVLMDIEMPGMDGIEATRRIKEESPGSRIIMLTEHVEELILARAVEAGASGYLAKTESIEQVPRAIRLAHRGEPLLSPDEVHGLLRTLRHRRSQEASERQRVDRLTPRETEILQYMADGISSPRIAEALRVSPYTLRTHVQNVLMKLGVHSKLEALALVIRHGKVTSRR